MLANSHFKHFAQISKNITFNAKRTYVKQSKIDEISSQYNPSVSTFQKLRMYAAIFQHIGLQGFKGLKQDITVYKDLRDRQQTLTLQQTKTLMRINHDILKLGPLFIIQILPFSGPLFMLYMYTYPGSIPSWFMIDYYHDRHQELKLQNQARALKHFQELGLKHQQIKLDEMSLRDLRKTCLLLFGIYRDGTVGYRKLFNKKIQYLFTESYSRFLIIRYLEKKFKRDLLLKKHTDAMSSLEEMVRWKFQRIMNGEYIFEYQPMYEKTLEKMKTNKGEESQIFKQIEQDSLSHNPPQANLTESSNGRTAKGRNTFETRVKRNINNQGKK